MNMKEDKESYVEIRKLRKKLRQIENLERICRPLNEDEALKVSKKSEFRNHLQNLLSKTSLQTKDDSIPTAILICPEMDTQYDEEQSKEDLKDSQEQMTIKKECENLKLQNEVDTIKRPCDGQGDDTPSRISRPTSPKRIKMDQQISEIPLAKSTEETVNGSLSSHQTDTEISRLKKIWRSSTFSVRKLEGHNDLITAVAADGNLIVSSSGDTTVRVWNADSGKELYSLRGHKGGVTCLILLRQEHSDELSRYLGMTGSHRLALSGAHDSTIILWSITTGEMKKSIYTFNTVTCAAYIQPEVCFITATDGGKLQIWDAVSGSMLRSFTAYDDAYSCIVASGSYLYTAAMEGIIKVWEVQDRDLKVKFSLEDLELPAGVDVILRMVRCMEVFEDWVFYGDDGPNIKAFNWKTGEVKKFKNHVCEWGATESLVCTRQELIASCYDIDQAKGYLNVRLYPSGRYLCSLDDGETGKICSIACTASGSGHFRIVTGGTELKVWNVFQAPQSGRRNSHHCEVLQKPGYISHYDKEAQQSEYDSSESDTEDETANEGYHERTYVPVEITHSRGLWSYCSIL